MSHVSDRRQFLSLVGGTLAGMYLPRSTGHSQPVRKPNFIVILADDLGYGDISGFGLTKSPFQTPNLERMAADGDCTSTLPAACRSVGTTGWTPVGQTG